MFKLDLEACCVVAGPGGPRLIALGSGSRKRRRRVVILDAWHEAEPCISLIEADALYLALESAADFAGSDMNIEGAVALPHALRLFGRGNGEPRRGREPLNATCDLALPALLAYFAAAGVVPAPRPTSIIQYDLGSLDGLPLGFTDAALCGGAVLYAAAAENSANAGEDGQVTGSVLGVLPEAGTLRHTPLTGAGGAATRDKIEGVAPAPDAPDHVFVVIDADERPGRRALRGAPDGAGLKARTRTGTARSWSAPSGEVRGWFAMTSRQLEVLSSGSRLHDVRRWINPPGRVEPGRPPCPRRPSGRRRRLQPVEHDRRHRCPPAPSLAAGPAAWRRRPGGDVQRLPSVVRG